MMQKKYVLLSMLPMLTALLVLLNVCSVQAAGEEIRFVKTANGWEYQKNGVTDTSTTGFVQYEGQWFHLTKGILDETLNGFVSYKGEIFYAAAGRICIEYSGLVQEGDRWGFLANGQFQKHYTGLALYDGEWFLLKNGILYDEYNGLYAYDGAQFLIAAGRIAREYSGLYLEDGKWYFLAEGQVCDYTGLTLYDEEWFYVSSGILNTAKTGYVGYNGDLFYVTEGHLETQSAKASQLERAKQSIAENWEDINRVLERVNQYRAEKGVDPVQLDRTLCLISMIRAIEMADNEYFEHDRPDGSECFTLFYEVGYRFRQAGENIGRNYETADAVCEGWRNSVGHYYNMTDEAFTSMGIGVQRSPQGVRYWAQEFALPRQ